MITLTDDERDTALRAARYCVIAMKRAAAPDAANVAKLEALVRVLEAESSLSRNGVWRCACPSPWRLPAEEACATCGGKRP